MFDLLITNGKVVTSEAILNNSVAIKDGKIAALIDEGIEASAKKIIDAKGNYIFPGFIDTHAHINEPGFQWREDFEHGTKAAALGGFTTIIDMPVNNDPAVVDVNSMKFKVDIGNEHSYVDFGIWGGLIPSNFNDLSEMYDEGCLAFKSFLSPTGPDFSSLSYGQALEAMDIIAKFGGRVGFHCEDYSIIEHLEGKMKKEGKTDWQGFLESRPLVAEMVATLAIIEIAKVTGCKVHICHVSSPAVAEKIRQAQKEGYDITAETCPHYLSMTKDELLANGALFKCAPPLREKEDVDGLWEYVIDGTFSGIGSDHSPSCYDEKFVEIGGKKIETAFDPWGGMNGIQTCVQTILSEGCNKRKISPVTIANVMCKKPAMAFGIYGKKGDIMPGFDADIALVDLDKEWEVKAEDLKYLNQVSSFVGKKGKGAVYMTILRGNIVCENGETLVEPGYGTYVSHL